MVERLQLGASGESVEHKEAWEFRNYEYYRGRVTEEESILQRFRGKKARIIAACFGVVFGNRFWGKGARGSKVAKGGAKAAI